MGFRRAPDKPGFVQRRVDVREARRPEVVDVVGELRLQELISRRSRYSCGEQHLGREHRRGPQQGQRSGALLIDVERQQSTNSPTDQLGGLCACLLGGITHLLRRAASESFHMHSFNTSPHPWSERDVNGISQHGRVVGETAEIIS